VSLWDVDDEATSILMRNFFRNLQAAEKDPDVYEAFMKARCQLMYEECDGINPASLSTKKKTLYAKPKYSNAFILIDVL
jgi:CHAT domain-containing protein